MHNEKTIELVLRAIRLVLRRDKWLLIEDINEPCISHRLATYLQIFFPEYCVDCEYNGNIEDYKRKKISRFLREKLEELNLLTKTEKNETEYHLIERYVYPDIVIHERGTNKNNLCIIEVKKTTNRDVDSGFDELKLESYTGENFGNALNYKLGIFIIFETGTKEPKFHLQLCVKGEMLEKNESRALVERLCNQHNFSLKSLL